MKQDITGQVFGRLKAVKFLYYDQRHRDCWLFRCECGTEKVLKAIDVNRGNTKSCGCLKRALSGERTRRDITGLKVGRLTAVRPTKERDASGSVIWECVCECGNTVYYSVSALKQNRVRSCGCYYQETRAACPTYRRDFREGTSLSSLVVSKELRSDNTSGCTGVHFDRQRKLWIAYINFQKKRYWLGTFENREDAIAARKLAEKRLHDPILMEEMDQLTEESKHKFVSYLCDMQEAQRKE